MDFPRLISTKDVPHKFLKATFPVGTVPFKALSSDPRVSYTMYIPADHYNPDPSRQHSQDLKDLPPAYQLPLLPLVVSIHSTGRNAEECRNRLIEFANSVRFAVLAPFFPLLLTASMTLTTTSYSAIRACTRTLLFCLF